MMQHSGKHTIRWSLLLCVVYSLVTYTNGEKNGYHQGQIAITTVPICIWSIFWSQRPDMRKLPMGRLL